MEEDVHEIGTDSERSEANATPISEESSVHSSNILSRKPSRSTSSARNRKRKEVPKDDDTTEVMKLVGRKLESLQEDDALRYLESTWQINSEVSQVTKAQWLKT